MVDKLAGIFKDGGITGITVVRMEVPCCGGLSWGVQKALQMSGRTDLPLREVVVGVRGDIVSERAQTTGIPGVESQVFLALNAGREMGPGRRRSANT